MQLKAKSLSMCSVLIATLFSAAFFGSLPARAQERANPSEAEHPSVDLPPELDRVLRDYERTWAASSPAEIAALFTPDGFALPSGRGFFRGRKAIEGAYAGAGGTLHLRALAFETSGNVGYLIGAYSYDPAQGDRGKFVLALHRGEDGTWLIAADIDSAIQRR